MRVKKHIKLGILSLTLFASLFAGLAGSASAAGSAVITAEGPSSVAAGSEFDVSFFVTPSGADLFSAEVSVSLTNLTYVKAVAATTQFSGTGFATSSTDTSFTVVASHANNGSSNTKVRMLTVTLRAGSAAATGQIALSGAVAKDVTVKDLDPNAPMNASAQNRSVTVSCPSGQTGTPPSCTSPSGGGGSGAGTNTDNGGTTNTNTTPRNVVNNPVPGSTIAVGTDENGNPNVMTEDEFSIGTVNANTSTETTMAAAKPASSKRALAIGGIIALLILVLVGVKLVLSRVSAGRTLNRHVNGAGAVGTFGSSESVGHVVEPGSDHKDDDSTPPTPPSGPTIISPQQ